MRPNGKQSASATSQNQTPKRSRNRHELAGAERGGRQVYYHLRISSCLFGVQAHHLDNSTDKIRALPGPILILGAGGFIGANLLRALLAVRDDVYGTTRSIDNWRLKGISPASLIGGEFDFNHRSPSIAPSEYRTVFNCLAYGGYSWQPEENRIYETNFDLTRRIVECLAKSKIVAYVHAGSSSEYGTNCSGPTEEVHCQPNSHYAVSKLAATQYLAYRGTQGFPCATLRLYSVYGPWEHEDRLIPQVVRHGLKGEYPPFVNPNTTRDFVYVDDVIEAFVDAAFVLASWDNGYLKPQKPKGLNGSIYNIGYGAAVPIFEVVDIAKREFGIIGEPSYTMVPRDWDTDSPWFANTVKAKNILGWQASTTLEEGVRKTAEWMKERKN